MLFSDDMLQRLRLDAEQHFGLRLDAGETAALARQLEFVYARVYDIKYAELKARRFIPIDSSVDTGAEFYTYRMWNSFGMAQIIANYADDLPRVSSLAEEVTASIKSLGASYGFSVQDIRRAAMSGSPLQLQDAKAVRRAHEQAFDDIMANGRASAGLTGFLNNANVPIVAATTGTWVTLNSTPLQMIADLNVLVNSIITATLETFEPDTLLLDNAAFLRINSTPMSSTGDAGLTVLKFFLENSPYIRNVDQWNRLNTAGAGSTTRAVAYKRDSEVLEGVEPQSFEQFPPQAKNLESVIPTHSRIGGVKVIYPLAIAFMDGLGA